MSLSGLNDPLRSPESEDLALLLGSAVEHWYRLIASVTQEHEPVCELWHFGGSKNGWILRLKRKERIILYMIPQAGGFLVAFVLGERAVERAFAAPLPATVRDLIDEAPRYAEGRGFRMPIRGDEDIRAVLQLAAAKMAS